MADLRVYLQIESLQTQFAAYMATALRARGYVPLQGMHSLIIEIAPALAIHRVIDLALKSVPGIEPGILYVERQFGILELHSTKMEDLEEAGNAILDGFSLKAEDRLKPRILYSDLVAEVVDQHSVIINRQRDASMILPGESLLLLETAPALFAAAAANEAEKAVPENVLVDCQMFGVSGRVFISGDEKNTQKALSHVLEVIENIPGREH